MKKSFLLAILASLAIFFGCSNGSGSSSSYKEKNITPGGTEEATLIEMTIPPVDAGETGNIFIHFEPKNAAIYISCDTELADFSGDSITVKEDEKGVSCTVPFKTKAAGSFDFYAKSESGNIKKSGIVKINPVISSLEIKGDKKELDNAGDTLTLSAVTNPAVAGTTITWRSSNPEIATVDTNGKVAAVKPGKATITASTKKKPNNEADSTLVSATFEITVKGFYLNANAYYLYTKVAEYEESVTATATGYSDYTIEWTSSDTGIFTVEPGTNNDAKLKYADNAAGSATLTATLKNKNDGTKLAETTAEVHVFRFEMVALGDSIAAGYAAPKMGGTYGKDDDMEESDFLAAYNKYVKRRAEGSKDYDYVNEFAHPAIIGKDYKDRYNIRVRSYAKSGDQTSDLIEKLGKDFEDASLGTRKGEIYDAVNNAQIITLCIGANDILHHAMGVNIVTKSVDEFRTLLSDSFESFKVNFDTILQKLTGNYQQVLVMSIYNPYNYFDANNIPADQVNAEVLFGFIKTQKILDILPVAIEYLNKMNAYIKEKADGNINVTFVDVADYFNKIPAADHHTYVNVDPSKFSLEGLVSTFGQTIPIWFDPHPRKVGQDKIAKIFEEQMGE